MKSNYGPDARSLGGRQMLIEKLQNHHTKLIGMKPSMQLKKPRAHVDAKRRKKGYKKEYNNNYEETRETFKRAWNVKNGDVDHKAPKSMQFRKMLKKKQKKKFKSNYTRNRKEEFEQREHQKRLQNQKRRMAQIGKKQERKKNPNDPISHPVKFFRRAKNPTKNKDLLREDIKLDYLFSEINTQN